MRCTAPDAAADAPLSTSRMTSAAARIDSSRMIASARSASRDFSAASNARSARTLSRERLGERLACERPSARQRQMRAQRQQMASLQVGDEIVTAGGLYGTVKEVEDNEVRLEVAPDVVVRVAKRAVAAVLTENAPDELEAGETAEESDGTLPSA